MKIDVFSEYVFELGHFGNALVAVNALIMLLLIIFYTHQHLYAFLAVFVKSHKFKNAKKNHRYGYLISARNEEKVIGKLIDSIYSQNYPPNLMHVFVVADNCDDDTADVARKHGAIVFERFNEEQKGKSYALDYLIKMVFMKYDNLDIDAFFVFDADNLLSKSYTKEMNRAYDSGVKVCTSFRDSKNYSANWISAGSAMAFYRECRLIHHSRTKLGLGTYVSGTGFYVDKNVLKDLGGWPYHTMVEDIEFSINCAINNVKVGYCEQACFYDEQPEKLTDSLNQRLRWCKGTHQCFEQYEGKLLSKILFKFRLTCVDLLIHITPFPLLAFIWLVIYLIAMGINCIVLQLPLSFYLDTAIRNTFSLLLVAFVIAFLHALLVTALMGIRIKAPISVQLWYAITFPFYMFFYIPLSFIAAFKDVSWKKIPHTVDKSIEHLE